MSKEIEQLVKLSQKLGNDIDQIQAAGGNTSFKNDEFVWVKGSGQELKYAGRESFVQCYRSKLEENLSKTYSQNPDISTGEAKDDLMAAMVNPDSELVPSVETSLHVMLSYPYVAHTHPTLVNALTCTHNGKKRVQELFGENTVFVEYNYPGYTLFTRIKEETNNYRQKFNKDPEIIFLQNHGIVVSGDNPDAIEKLLTDVTATIREAISDELIINDLSTPTNIVSLIPAMRMIWSDYKDEHKINPLILQSSSTSLSHHFADSLSSFNKVEKPFCFDHAKFNGGAYLYVEPSPDHSDLIEKFQEAIQAFRSKEKRNPHIALVKGLGLIAMAYDQKTAATRLELFENQMKISYYADIFGEQLFLSDEDVSLIDERNPRVDSAETVQLDSGDRLVHNRIAIVTGAAQGFGEGIARDLFGRGANLVIADLNEVTSGKLVNELNHPAGKNKAIFIKTDVSDPESVENLIEATVKEFGGLDLMVSNAGVLFAGSLDEMDADTFDFVTRVNYKGYFLCAKYSSAVMKMQAKYNPDHFTDIIQINSKSGLKGSNKNFAYAGGKFGGIGLTQSFALELMPYRIKVNAVCPGNLFDGPLWSDPDNGLFVQYLKAGKVPGAKTIADVKRFYEAQVPANRGCTVPDVMKAIYYIIDQEYETGQAVPVTGGQNMLK